MRGRREDRWFISGHRTGYKLRLKLRRALQQNDSIQTSLLGLPIIQTMMIEPGKEAQHLFHLGALIQIKRRLLSIMRIGSGILNTSCSHSGILSRL